MMQVDKAALDSCLTDIEFPADVTTIVECAEGNECSRDVISQLQSTPSRTFSSKDELYCRLGDEQSCRLD